MCIRDRFVFSDLGTYKPGAGWNVYSEIRRKLAEDYGIPPVSYTHLDVYKRQEEKLPQQQKEQLQRCQGITYEMVLHAGRSLSLIHI